jgi:hypothetical protein
MAGRIGGKLTVRWPTPGQRYDALNEAAFRSDLERLFDRLGGELGGGQENLANVDQDATPDVSGGDLFTLTNSVATTITAFNGAEIGQRVLFIFADANTTIQDASIGGVIQLAGGANFVGSANDTLELVWDGTNWYEVSRSVN